MRVPLYEIAHSRAGDKGTLNTLSLIPYDKAWYPVLCEYALPEAVREHLSDRVVGRVTRYELPNLTALLFVCTRADDDSVTTSLHTDGHGKSMSSALLEMVLDVPEQPTRFTVTGKTARGRYESES